MLRITRLDGTGNTTLLRLEGRLAAADLDEFATLLQACHSDRRQVVVELSGLVDVDGPAASALAGARDGRTELVGASAYVDELLNEVAS